MKKTFLLSAAILGLGVLAASAQFGGRSSGGAGGPDFGDAMAKLFGQHQQFSAMLEAETAATGKPMKIPGKIAFDAGKVRFEFNISQMKGGDMPPEATAHMKSMGLDSMVSITRPDKNVTYMIYPDSQSYVEMALRKNGKSSSLDEMKVETTDLGKEAAEGHDCIKKKVIVTEPNGAQHESTVWAASDLQGFPVRIETTEQGHHAVMHFKDVKFDKPEAKNFEAPADFTKCASMQELMMKKMGGMPGMPGMMPPRVKRQNNE